MQNKSYKREIKREYNDGVEIHECELEMEDTDYAPLMSEFVIEVEPNESFNDVEIESKCIDEMSHENASEIVIKTETYEEHPLKWEELKEDTIEGGVEKSNNREEEHFERENSFLLLFQCEVCNKSFNRKHNLVRHSKIHTDEKPFQCEVCNKSFNRNHHLYTHSKIHTGEKPFQCELCNKSFNQKHHLIRHLKVHTGEKPFQCEVCNKYFNRKHNLITHSKIHTGEKPFQCEVCNKSYNRKQHLLRHSKIHIGKNISKDEILISCVDESSKN